MYFSPCFCLLSFAIVRTMSTLREFHFVFCASLNGILEHILSTFNCKIQKEISFALFATNSDFHHSKFSGICFFDFYLVKIATKILFVHTIIAVCLVSIMLAMDTTLHSHRINRHYHTIHTNSSHLVHSVSLPISTIKINDHRMVHKATQAAPVAMATRAVIRPTMQTKIMAATTIEPDNSRHREITTVQAPTKSQGEYNCTFGSVSTLRFSLTLRWSNQKQLRQYQIHRTLIFFTVSHVQIKTKSKTNRPKMQNKLGTTTLHPHLCALDEHTFNASPDYFTVLFYSFICVFWEWFFLSHLCSFVVMSSSLEFQWQPQIHWKCVRFTAVAHSKVTQISLDFIGKLFIHFVDVRTAKHTPSRDDDVDKYRKNTPRILLVLRATLNASLWSK